MSADGHLPNDRFSQVGRHPAPQKRYDLVVVGAGEAGVKAATEAAAAGRSVLLVDEHPLDPGLIGLDVPYLFGGRATAAVQTPSRLMEHVFAARPALEAAVEAGVELELGVSCWGLYVNGPNLQTLASPVIGLADLDRAWMVGFDAAVIATGARDLVLGFPGWDQPGVVGARGFAALTDLYDAFAGRRVVILGTGELALATAETARARGIEVVALVEALATAQGDPARLAALGAPVLLQTVPVKATGGIDGVEQLTLRSLADGSEQTLACDTVVMALGLVPQIELLDAAGAKIVRQADRGGFVPQVAADGQTSLTGVKALGEVTGVDGADTAYGLAWMQALMAATPGDTMICQCEDVTRADLLDLRPPRYLGEPSTQMRRQSLARLAEDGPVNQDQIKRLTRACMGPCQARRCREQTAMAMAIGTDTALGAIPLAGYRAPVRPLPLKVIGETAESPDLTDNWDVWFGIPEQWIPYPAIGTDAEAEQRAYISGAKSL